jgi:hypothetical protein
VIGVPVRRAVQLLLALLLVVGACAPPAGAFVYWSGDPSLGRADLDGTPDPGEPWLSAGGEGCGVTVDTAHVYWTTRSGTIGRADLDGSDSDPAFVTLSGGSACGVAVDAGHLYWASSSSGKLGRATIDGSAVEPGWMSPGVGHGCGIAVDAADVYWATGSGVYSAPLSGGPPATISTATTENCGVAVNAAHIYWATGAGYIERDLLSGGPPTPIVKAPLGPCGVAVDSHYVYWGNSASDSVGRANLDGSGLDQRFAEGAHGPCGVAVDSLGPVGGHGQGGAPSASLPSNAFRLGHVSKNRKHGTARLELLLPGPGSVVLAGRRVIEKRVVEDVPNGGGSDLTSVEIAVKPRHRVRAILRRYGVAVAALSVTYTPLGGLPRTRYTQVWLALRGKRSRRGRAPRDAPTGPGAAPSSAPAARSRGTRPAAGWGTCLRSSRWCRCRGSRER